MKLVNEIIVCQSYVVFMLYSNLLDKASHYLSSLFTNHILVAGDRDRQSILLTQFTAKPSLENVTFLVASRTLVIPVDILGNKRSTSRPSTK